MAGLRENAAWPKRNAISPLMKLRIVANEITDTPPNLAGHPLYKGKVLGWVFAQHSPSTPPNTPPNTSESAGCSVGVVLV